MNLKLLKEIHDTIINFDTIYIFPHNRPDGDAMGTAFGLKHMLDATYPNKLVTVVGESSEFTKFVGVPDVIEDESVFENALGISVDTGNLTKLGNPQVRLCKFTIKVDHHIKAEDFGDIEYIDTSRPAAALLVLDLYEAFKDEYILTKEAAEALYFGILTDTGRFKYSSVTGDTFRSVSKLYDIGFDSEKIYRYLDARTIAFTQYKGFVLQNIQFTENGVAYFKVLPEYLERFNVSLEEATSIVNELGVFKDIPIWALFAEYEGGVVRCRLRSKGPAINKLAAKYEGGGHAMASGAQLGTWDRVGLILKDADELAKEYLSK